MLKISKSFYEALSLALSYGDLEENRIIMKNQHAMIGLFQDVFEKYVRTSNPAWNESAKPLGSYADVRQIQKELQNKGVGIPSKIEESSEGPSSMMIFNPDENPILIDQHV